MKTPSSNRSVLFSIAFVLAALTQLACEKTPDANAAQTGGPANTAAPAALGRVIDIKVADGAFTPSNIEAKKGETITLRFTRTQDSECLKAIAIPSLKIEKDLPMNKAVDVTITPTEAGKIVFQCWMAMVKGSIDVKG